MTYATRNLIIFTAIIYGLGAIGLYLRAPSHIQNYLAAPSSNGATK